MKPIVIAVGALPPPVHGASLANAAMLDNLRAHGADLAIVDLAGGTGRGWRSRAQRVPRVAGGLCRLAALAAGRRSTVYVSVAGGYGQLYDVLFVALARLVRARVVLHHHSYAYVTRRMALTAALIRLAGPRAIHVALCNDMGRRLGTQYGCGLDIRVVSNAALIRTTPQPAARQAVRTVGFLGNISKAKGVAEFLEVMRVLATIPGPPVSGLLAGRFENEGIESIVRTELGALRHVEYVGAVDTETKPRFFDRIDVLLFPTKYANEAEPLTITEAMAYAVPVIAWGRGCIHSMVPAGGGLVVDPHEEFTVAAVAQLQHWMCNPSEFSSASERAWAHFRAHRQAYLVTLAGLCEEILTATGAVPALVPQRSRTAVGAECRGGGETESANTGPVSS